MDATEVTALATRYIELRRAIAEQEEATEELKRIFRVLAEEDIPSAMKEMKLKEFTLETGETVVVVDDCNVGIPADRREEAYDWLEKNNFGGLIKTYVRVEFGKGELGAAKKLISELQKKKLPAELARDIHWQTLKAFAREQKPSKEKGQEQKLKLPMDLLGIHYFSNTKVTRKD